MVDVGKFPALARQFARFRPCMVEPDIKLEPLDGKGFLPWQTL